MEFSKIRCLSLVLALLGTFSLMSASESGSESGKSITSFSEISKYLPNIHGTVRPRFEVDTDAGEYRFQVRNARLSLDGAIAPSVDWYFNTDFCDRGKIKILDAWARVRVVKGLAFQAGQFRMPFGVETFRAPHTYLFANRSFIGKQMCNVRAVGAKVTYGFDRLPLVLEAGVFNPTTIGDHETWNKDLSYAVKALYTLDGFKFSTGFQSIIPDGVRTNLVDAFISWGDSHWLFEGDYMYKHYTNSAHKACHGYCINADYRMPVKLGAFNRMSFQARFDGMTDHSSAVKGDDGCLLTNDPARNRVTVGATISYIRSKNMFLDIRANYENYFYHDGYDAPAGQGDRVVVEMVLRF